MSQIPYVVDEQTNIAIVQPSNRLIAPILKGYGTLTYRCHSCGDLMPKHWEVIFVDPASGWIGHLIPVPLPSTLTTHHEWHMELEGDA